MFGIARTIAQHKLLMVALLLAGYFLFAGEKQAPTTSSPWGADAPAQAVTLGPKEATMTEKALKLAYGAAEYIGVEDYLPASMGDQGAGGMVQAGSALDNIAQQQD